MEIDIRLAGVQLGPYSVKQVREYLNEGLLSAADQAKIHGSDDWITVTEMLASHEEEPESAPEMTGATEAETEPLPPSSAPATPESADAPVAESVGEAAAPVEPEDARRAPDPASNVSHLPTRPKEPEKVSLPAVVEALSRKTILIGPSAPSAPSSSGRTGYSVATTTPLSQTSSSVKKTARAAMVKTLAQQTSPLPTKSILPSSTPPATSPPPSAPNDGITPGPGQADPSKPRESLLKSLQAKTVPMRTNAAPPLQASNTLPVTAPLPTKAAFRPPSGPTSPPSVVDDLTKKLGQMVQPDPVRKTEPLHPSLRPKPESKPEPEPKEGEKVETVQIPLKKIKALEKTAAPAPEPDETPKAPKRQRSLAPVLYGVAAVSLFVLYYVWSPTHAASQLRTALNDGDATELDSAIAFAAVQDSLKEQVQSELSGGAATNPSVKDAIDMLDKSIDLFVTKQGISGLVSKSGTFSNDQLKQTISFEAARNIFLAFNSQAVQSQQWAGLTDYTIQMDATRLHLRTQALNWKLKQVDLSPALLAASSPGTASPLLQPVVETYMERGDALTKNSDWNGAIANYTAVLAVDPNSSVAYNARGVARQSQGDLEGASKDFTQALSIDPQMAAAYDGRGNVKSAKGDLDGAIADYTQAVHFDPNLAAAYDGRGNAKTAKEDLEGAIADFTQAISIDPNLASAYSDRGFARQANGNLDGAIEDYTTAINLKPKTAMVYYNRGLARQSQGNFEAAIVDFDRALAFDPKNAQALYNRGQAKSATHDLDGAIADYTQAIAVNPKLALAYCYRGVDKQAKGDLNGAAADYTQALSIDPKIAIAYYNRAHIRQLKGDADGAIADSSQALTLDPKNWQAYFDRGFAKMAHGDLDGAQDDLKTFCDSGPRENDSDQARLYLWLIAKQLNSKTDADQALSDALENNWNGAPDDVSSKTAAFLLGRMNESDYLAVTASPDPTKAPGLVCETYYFAGMKRMLMGDKLTATDYFNKALATDQTDQHEYLLAQAQLKALQAAPAPAPAAPPATPSPTITPAPAPAPAATAPPNPAPMGTP